MGLNNSEYTQAVGTGSVRRHVLRDGHNRYDGMSLCVKLSLFLYYGH